MAAVSSSLWFVPSLMAVAATGLALLMAELDRAYGWRFKNVPLVFSGTADGASATLATIAGSFISITGVVFSITIVALSLASSQLGPRLLRNFMRDRANQLVLGTFIGTFVYALVGLQAVDRDAGAAGIPNATVTGAFLLSLASLAVLIYFIHHISSSMQADTVIANVAAQLEEAIARMYPTMGEGVALEDAVDEANARDVAMHPGAAVPARRDGYVQAIDEDDVLRLASERDLVLRIEARPGDYLARGRPLAHVWPPERVTETVVEALQEAIILGSRRTDEQDVEFLINQLVEPAVRALSPGINDPFTAIACLDRLGSAIGDLARRRFPRAYRTDAQGKLRVIARSPSFQHLLGAAFDPIRQHGAPRPMVGLALLDTLEAVAAAIPPGDPNLEHVRAQAAKVYRTALAAPQDPEDMRAFDARYQTALRTIDRGGTRDASAARA